MRVLIAGVLLLLSTHLAMAETRVQNCAQTPGVNVVSWQSTLKDSERGWAVVKIDVPSGRTLSSAHATLGADAGTTVADTAVYTALPYGPVTAGRYPLTLYATDSLGCTGHTYASRTVNVKQFIVPIAPPVSVPGVLTVCASGCQYALSQFQAALNAVQCGQTITIAAGQTVVGSDFSLPNKGVCSNFITVTTDTPSNISPDGTRVTSGQFAAMPKLQSTNGTVVMTADAKANHWRFSGLEIWSSYSSLTFTVYGLIFLGQNPNGGDLLTLADLPDAMEFKHCYFHGIVGANLRRAIAANATNVLVQDSYLNEIHEVGADSQGVGWWNTPGPITIRNNYISAAGENIMSGGSPAGIPTVVPADILVENNYFTKDPKWNPNDVANYAGIHYVSKNLSELKNATRVTFRHNILDNSFEPDQSGYCMTLTVRTELGVMTNATVSHIEIGNNIFRNCRTVFNMQAKDDNGTGSGGIIKIHNNLFYNIGTAITGGAGSLDISVNTENTVVFDHNTFIYGLSPDRIMTVGSYHPPPAVVTYDVITNFIMRNNLLVQGTYGIIGDNTAPGNSSIAAYLPASAITKNLLSGPDNSAIYPAGNLFAADAGYLANFRNPGAVDYRLLNTSAYKRAGTDGKDLGYDPCNGLFPDPASDGRATVTCPADVPLGRIFYVATTGNNANPGTIGSPWLTINYALTHAACGDLIYVRAGTYAQGPDTFGNPLPVNSCGSWANALTMQAYPSEAVHMPGAEIYAEHYLIFKDLFFDGLPSGGSGETIGIASGAPANSGGHIRFVNCDIHGNNTTPPHTYSAVAPGPGSEGFNEFIGGKIHDTAGVGGWPYTGPRGVGIPHCFYASSSNNLVDGVEFYHCAHFAIQILYSNASNNIVRNNYFHNNGSLTSTLDSILTVVMGAGSNNLFYNNILAHNINGIQLGTNGQPGNTGKVYNNTFYQNGVGGSPCGTVCYSAIYNIGPNSDVRNNIVYGNFDDSITGPGTGLTQSNNLLGTNPLFVNPAGNDFHLQSSSAAKVGGTTLTNVSSDFDGIVRPQGATYAIGAYEVSAP